jgi:lyso-ornithine lipid O-acyltransferase
MAAAHLLDTLRFSLRTGGFVGLTLGMYGLLEVDSALTGATARDVVLHKWMRRYGRALLQLYGLEVRAGGPFIGDPPQDHAGFYPERDARGIGRLFVMNHRSAFDVTVTLSFFEATIVSRADLAGWPVIGMVARRVGTLFVDRASKRSGAAVVAAMAEALKAGRGVMIFPEGTTFGGDEVRPFRPGGFMAAHQVGAEIVPIGIAYGDAHAFFHGNQTFSEHMARVSGARRTAVAIEVGTPIVTAGEDFNVSLNAAHEAVQALVHRARTVVGVIA